VYLDNHRKYLDDNAIISDNAVVKDAKYVNNVNNVDSNAKNVKDFLLYSDNNHNHVEEFEDTLYPDGYEVTFDVNEILKHQNYLDDNVIISDNTVLIVNDLNDAEKAKILPNISASNYSCNDVGRG
jgi:hypothetical protein